MLLRVLGNTSCDLDLGALGPWLQGQDQIIYFLVNPSSLKLLEVATSNLQVHRSYDLEGTGQHFV